MPDDDFDYPALRYLLTTPERLFPEERLELVQVLGKAERLRLVEEKARVRIPACVCNPDTATVCVWHLRGSEG